jgi:hypothetical protein
MKAATSEEGENIRHDFRKIVDLEVEKRIFGSSTGLREVSEWTLWRDLSPPKRKIRGPKHSPRERKNGGTPVGFSRRIALRMEQYARIM